MGFLGLSLPKKKDVSNVFAGLARQFNPLDNNQTYKQQTPVGNRSALGQLTHNAITNTVGNLGVKPFILNPSQMIAEAGRGQLAQLTGNFNAMKASDTRQAMNFRSSIPGQLTNIGVQSFNTAKNFPRALQSNITGGAITGNPTVDAILNPAGAIFNRLGGKSHAPTVGQSQAILRGSQAFQQTPAAWTVSPAQKLLANRNPVIRKALEESGYDVNKGWASTGIDTAGGVLTGVGLAKGGEALVNKGKAYVKTNAKPVYAHEAPKGVSVKEVAPTVPPKAAEKKVTVRSPEPVVPVKPGRFSGAYLTAEENIGRGTSSGSKIQKIVHDTREGYESASASYKSAMPTAEKLGKKDFAHAWDVAEGKAQPKNPTIAKAAAEMRTQLDKFIQYDQGKKLSGAKYRQNYMPHFVNPKNLKEGSSGWNAAIKQMVDNKTARSETEAVAFLRSAAGGVKGKKMGSLEMERLYDNPNYPKTKEALHHYFDEGSKRLEEIKQYGKNNQKIDELIAKVGKEGGDAQKAQQYFDVATDRKIHGEGTSKAANIATGIQGSTKLGVSAIGNAAQNLNTAVTEGIARTVKAAAKSVISKEDKQFVRETGVRSESVAKEALHGQGIEGPVRKITSPFFERVEKANRGTAAIAGRDSARALVRKGTPEAETMLREKYGVTGKIGKELTHKQEVQAGRATVEKTQFRTGSQDLPAWASSPGGRVVSQFKRYPYKQTRFLGREVFGEAGKGNVLPLVRMASLGPGVGLDVNKAKDTLRGSNQNDSTVDKLFNLSQSSGMTGLETSIARGLIPKKSMSGTEQIARTFGGPTVGDAANLANGIWQTATGGGIEKLKRFGLQHIPLVNTQENRIMPYNSSKTVKVSADGKLTGNESIAQLDSLASAEKKSLKAGKPGSYSLQQLSDGSYAYQIGNKIETKANLEDARNAIAEDSFKKSGADTKVIGDQIYIKKGDGNVSHEPKIRYDYRQTNSKNALELDRAVGSNNLKKWASLADNQLTNLESEKKLYNPATEQDKIDAITLKQENLMEKAQKYAEWGGFKKPSTLSKTDRQPINVAKYLSPISTGGSQSFTPRGVSVNVPKVAVQQRRGGGTVRVSRRRARA